MDDDRLASRKAALDEVSAGLEKLSDRAALEHWPADERAALADERDGVADAIDAVAFSFDELANDRDADAVLRQLRARARTEAAIVAQPSLEPGRYLRYQAAQDRDRADADRAASSADRGRSAIARVSAAKARQRAAIDRDEAVIDRAFADAGDSDAGNSANSKARAADVQRFVSGG